jgi:type II secretory pathway pseudopilin PulG
MVVIAIIAILAVIGLLVATKVTEGGRESQARNIIHTLDKTLENYAADRGASKFPFSFTDDQKFEYPIIDARAATTTGTAADEPEPTLQLFLLATAEAPSVMSAVNGIEGKAKTSSGGQPMVQLREVSSPTYGSTLRKKTNGGFEEYKAPVVYDPWGNAIRLVHPRFQGGYGKVYVSKSGAYTSTDRDNMSVTVKRDVGIDKREFRRSIRPIDPGTGAAFGDGDEGLCAGSRPYFYSPGPDKDPGKRRDNIYSEPPQFPEETRKDVE